MFASLEGRSLCLGGPESLVCIEVSQGCTLHGSCLKQHR